jgi:hypothetical protein
MSFVSFILVPRVCGTVHALPRATVRALRGQDGVVETGGIVSVVSPGLGVALRQLLWQAESRTARPMSGTVGFLEDGRGIRAAGQRPGGTDAWGRRSRGMRQDHAAAALARRIVQLEARRTSRSQTDQRGRADAETPSPHAAGPEAPPCRRMGGGRDRRRHPPRGHGQPRFPATPEPGDPADVLRAEAGGRAMAMAPHASGGTVAAVCLGAYEMPTVGGGEVYEGVEGRCVRLASS